MSARRDLQDAVQAAESRAIVQNNDSFYAKCKFSASNFFSRKPRAQNLSMSSSSFFDGWARGTFSKLRKAISNRPTDGPMKVLTDPMLREVFHEIDVKHVGMIRTRQLEKALRHCGLDVSRAAVRMILQELGMDPTDGLTADDFVRFFREAEVLTKLAREANGEDNHCLTYCLIFTVFSNAVVCCVFFWKYQGAKGDERSTWLLALIGTGCSFGCFLLYLIFMQVCAMREAGRLLVTRRISVKSSPAPELIEENWQKPHIDGRSPWIEQEAANKSRLREASSVGGVYEKHDQQHADDWGESCSMDDPMVDPMFALPASVCQATCRENEEIRDRYDPTNYAQVGAPTPHSRGEQPVPYFNPLCSPYRPQPARVRRIQAGLYTFQPAPAGPFVNKGVVQGVYRY